MPGTLIIPIPNHKSGRFAAPAPECSWLEIGIFAVLSSVLCFAPMAFGAVTPWAMSVIHVVGVLLILLWALQQSLSGSLTIYSHPLILPCVLFGLLVFLQLALGTPVYRSDWITGAMNIIAYGLVMFVASQIFRNLRLVRYLMIALTAFGFAVAIFATAQNFSAPGKLYWSIVPRQGGWVFGPYVNHNHYAGLMELLVPIPILFTLRVTGWSKRILFGFIVSTMIATVALSQSRGGMISLACQLLFIMFAVVFRVRSRPGPALMVLGIATLAMLTWIGGGSLKTRYSATKQELNAPGDVSMVRVQILRDSFQLIKERPILGWGLRMFPVVFPKYRSFYTNQFINEAHNDYLQFIVETGFVGFSIILFFLYRLIRASIKRIRNWQIDDEHGMRVAAFAGCLGILVHSITDFNLQIPANALLFFVMSVIASGGSNNEAPVYQINHMSTNIGSKKLEFPD